MNLQRLALIWCLLCCGLVGWSGVAASTAKPLPNDIVSEITDELVVEIEGARDYYDDDPERFYRRVDGIISPSIDYRSFSRAVMGEYGTSKYYRQLQTTEEKEDLKRQVKSFTAAVKQRMVRTLSKGLMTFSGERIEVLPPDAEALARIEQNKSVSVTQLIFRDADQPLEVQFKLRPDKAGDWRMINVVLNNINLGKQYRTEFSSKLREFNGDIDRVIAYWGSVEDDPTADLVDSSSPGG